MAPGTRRRRDGGDPAGGRARGRCARSRAAGAGWRALDERPFCRHPQAVSVKRMAPQQHLERLSAVDASFLANESPVSHMHVGAVVILEGPPPDFTEFLDGLRARLHLVPRYRQKLAYPPLDSGRPLWVDDPDFNLEYHVRQT